MKNLLFFLYFSFTIAFLLNCNQERKNTIPTAATALSSDSLLRAIAHLKESYNEEDILGNEYLIEKLKPIRANFKRINSVKSWTRIDSLELVDESIEGGQAKFYYQHSKLEKIVKRNFGEMSQWLTEYYFLNDTISFVFERQYQYNAYFLDSAFNLEKSELIDNRNYFENGKLLHQLTNQDCGSPFTDEYLQEEQKGILEGFDKIIKQKPDH